MYIDPAQIPWLLKALTGGLTFGLLALWVYCRWIDPDWRKTLGCILDDIVPDSERRPRRWRR